MRVLAPRASRVFSITGLRSRASEHLFHSLKYVVPEHSSDTNREPDMLLHCRLDGRSFSRSRFTRNVVAHFPLSVSSVFTDGRGHLVKCSGSAGTQQIGRIRVQALYDSPEGIAMPRGTNPRVSEYSVFRIPSGSADLTASRNTIAT